MHCPICNKMIPDASRYCGYCGAAPRPARRGWPVWAVALLALATLGGGWLLGGARPAPTPQVIEKVVTQVVFVTPGPSPTPRPPTATPTKTVATTRTPEPTKTLPPGAQVSDVDGMVLLPVPAGEFLMGSADSDSDAGSDEKPQRKVYLDAYWIDRTEVTKEQYQKCVAAGKCAAPSCSGTGQTDHPVVCVSWQDAANYCVWAGRRLLTEAEWEKAARGTDGRKYPWGNQNVAGDLLNFCDRNCTFDWKDNSVDDGYTDTAPVGSYPKGASPYGALDMAGNVWEWVADWYNEVYYSSAPTQNPTGPDTGSTRVWRGGSWYYYQWNARAAVRLRGGPGNRHHYVGFRCARS